MLGIHPRHDIILSARSLTYVDGSQLDLNKPSDGVNKACCPARLTETCVHAHLAERRRPAAVTPPRKPDPANLSRGGRRISKNSTSHDPPSTQIPRRRAAGSCRDAGRIVCVTFPVPPGSSGLSLDHTTTFSPTHPTLPPGWYLGFYHSRGTRRVELAT
ncbi:hypothetical protein VTK56DRAFT_3830 [Thermocarpiscus australiensis]